MVCKDLVSHPLLSVEMHDVKVAAKHFFPKPDPLAGASLHKGHAEIGYCADSLAVHHG